MADVTDIRRNKKPVDFFFFFFFWPSADVEDQEWPVLGIEVGVSKTLVNYVLLVKVDQNPNTVLEKWERNNLTYVYYVFVLNVFYVYRSRQVTWFWIIQLHILT